VLAADGGVVGRSIEPGTAPAGILIRPSPLRLERPSFQDARAPPPISCKWLLGDFAAFGQLLAHQLASRDIEQEVPMRSDPTLIGTVQDVAGTTVSVSLVRESATGLSFFKGEILPDRQVGSFVRIPLGYTSLFGIVSQVGAGAAPKAEGDTSPWGNQWVRVQLVGEPAATASLSVVSRSTQPSMTQCT